jgi:hypothetical protein
LTSGSRRSLRARYRGRTAPKAVPAVVRALEADLRVGRPDVSALRRSHASARHGHRSEERRALPARARRADGGTFANARARAAVLEESCAPKRCRGRRGRRGRRVTSRAKVALRPPFGRPLGQSPCRCVRHSDVRLGNPRASLGRTSAQKRSPSYPLRPFLASSASFPNRASSSYAPPTSPSRSTVTTGTSACAAYRRMMPRISSTWAAGLSPRRS